MDTINFVLRRPHLIISLLLVFSVMGILGFFNIKQKLFPDTNRPAVSVVITYPGASASEIAEDVVIPVEKRLFTISKVRTVYSTTNDEITVITAEFEYEKEISEAVLNVQSELNKVYPSLPKGISQPQIYQITDATPPVLVLSLSPKDRSLSLPDLRQIAENQIKNRLLQLKEVANVDIFGGYKKEIFVYLDKNKINRYNLSVSEIIKIIKNSNINLPVGIISGKKGEFLLKISGKSHNIEELKNTFITPSIRLKDIAQIRYDYYINRSFYIGNGKKSVAVAIQRQPDGDALATIDAVKEIIPKLEKEFPLIEFSISDSQEKIIRLSNKNMLEALRDATIMVSIVIFLFLANLRQMIIASISIPFVYGITIGIMWLVGLEFNIVTLTGIILTLGMLVDDAVVVIENIERHLKELGKPIKVAVVEGTREVIFPILAGTIATTVVLIPLLFVGDYPEKIFRPLAETLIIAVIVSYFVSITVIPLVAPYLLKRDKEFNSIEKITFNLMEKFINVLKRFYITSAEKLMGNKLLGLFFFLFFIVLFVLSVRLILPVVGREIMPPMDTGIVKVHVTFDSNIPIEKVEKLTEKISRIISSDNRVEMFGISIGSEGGVLTVSSGGGINTLSATIHYIDRFHREETIWDIERSLREKLWKLPDIKYLHVYDYGATPLSSIKGNLDVRISGNDLQILDQLGKQMMELCYQVKGITSLSRTWDYDKTVYYLKIKQDRALYYGITPYEIGVQLASKIRGGYVSFINVPNEESIRVRVIYKDFFRQSIKNINSYYITTKKGKIPLSAVAQIEKQVEPSQITRQNLQYTLDILGYREKAAITHIVEDFKQLYQNSSFSLPSGYTISNEGDIKQLDDSMKRMFVAIILGIIFIYFALVPVFRSFLSPLSVIMAIPLSVIGASWSVLIMGYHQSMPGFMGIVLLSGIITKNSILLIEFIHRSTEKGKNLKSSIIDSIQIRTRPVLMTAFATSVGMIPIALGWALGLERLAPLGTVAIGGLMIGTFLTLIFVPVFYFYVNNLFSKVSGKSQ